MKTLLASATIAAIFSAPLGALAHGPEVPPPDTIVLKLRRADKVIIVTRPGQEGLRGLTEIDLNSLVRRLDSTLRPQAEQVIVSGKDTTIIRRITTGRDGQATKRVYAISMSTKKGIVIQERDENLEVARTKKAYKELYGSDWRDELERQMGPNWEQELKNSIEAGMADGPGAMPPMPPMPPMPGLAGHAVPGGKPAIRRPKAYSTFTTAFGLTNYLQTNGAGFPQGELENYTLRPWGSRYFSLGWRWGRRLGNSRTFFNYGFDFAWNNFMLQDAFRFTKDAATDRLGLIDYRQGGPGGAGNLAVDKSKLVLSTLKVPLGLDFGLGKGWHLEAGGFVGVRIDSYTKFKFTQDGNTRKDRVRSNYYLNELQYGGRLALRRNGWGAFGEVHANPLFTDKGPGLRAFQFGVFFAGI